MSDNHARKALHAYLSKDAHEQWHEFAGHEGVSVSAVLEALAPALACGESSEAGPTVDLGNVVSDARRIDARRRRRRRRQ